MSCIGSRCVRMCVLFPIISSVEISKSFRSGIAQSNRYTRVLIYDYMMLPQNVSNLKMYHSMLSPNPSHHQPLYFHRLSLSSEPVLFMNSFLAQSTPTCYSSHLLSTTSHRLVVVKSKTTHGETISQASTTLLRSDTSDQPAIPPLFIFQSLWEQNRQAPKQKWESFEVSPHGFMHARALKYVTICTDWKARLGSTFFTISLPQRRPH